MKRSELWLTVLLIPVDAVMLLLAYATSYWLRSEGYLLSPSFLASLSEQARYVPGELIPFQEYLSLAYYLVPIGILAFAATGLYRIRPLLPLGQRLARLAIGVTTSQFAILLIFLFRREFFLPRTTFIYTWILAFLFVGLGRLLFAQIQRYLHRFGIGVVRLGIVGDQVLATRVAGQFNARNQATYVLSKQYHNLSVDELCLAIQGSEIDELIVATEQYSDQDLVKIRVRCLEEHIGFSFVPAAFAVLNGASYRVRYEVDVPLIEVLPTPLDGWGRVVKRLFDVVVGAAFLVVLSPLLLLLMLAVYLSSPGPVFFRQARVGRRRSEVRVVKFRTMYQRYSGPDGEANFKRDHPVAYAQYQEARKLADDPRITPLGRIMRKFSLDELPQFWNVVRGDLSIVGPRPFLPSELGRIGDMARVLFTVRPGLTGFWQVSGRNQIPFDERVKMDKRYIEHWNLLWDLWLMLRTAGVVLRGTGQ